MELSPRGKSTFDPTPHHRSPLSAAERAELLRLVGGGGSAGGGNGGAAAAATAGNRRKEEVGGHGGAAAAAVTRRREEVGVHVLSDGEVRELLASVVDV